MLVTETFAVIGDGRRTTSMVREEMPSHRGTYKIEVKSSSRDGGYDLGSRSTVFRVYAWPAVTYEFTRKPLSILILKYQQEDNERLDHVIKYLREYQEPEVRVNTIVSAIGDN